MVKFTKLSFCQKTCFWHQTSSCKMFSESTLCRPSIKLFQQKLWYKLNSLHMPYLCTCHTKWLSLTSCHFAQKFIFFMTPLHAHTQYICIVLAKYQQASVKALVQVETSVYALSKHKQNMQTGQNGYYKVHKAVILSKIFFLASNFFMQMFNVSAICRQSIRWLQ